MLSKGRPQPGRHYFSKEDHVGYLYPKENPSQILDGILAYPISTKRIIKIEDFYMIIQVNGYRFNAQKPETLDWLDVTIEFTNTFEKEPTVGSIKNPR